ncbi:porin family protein [Novosphingobium sp.]|uniref:outer membrane protein n=1 Tax=Novosphingobium sp. TaxID=1874826 RepID=UPI0025FABFD5|nr:porin family protein [Novosphingobium sp.]
MPAKRLPLLTCAALALSGLAAGAAQAESPTIRATALAGLERTDSAPGTGAADGIYYGGQLGADWDLGGVQLGVEGELGESTASALVGTNRARQGVFASAALRLAVPLTGQLRVFARGGYAYHRISYDTGPDFSGSGYTLGAGAEADLSGPLFVRGEYRYSDYGSTVRGQQFLGGVGLRF